MFKRYVFGAILGTLIFQNTANAEQLGLPERSVATQYNSNSNITSYIKCGDFVSTEEADNNNGNKKEDVQNHVQQFNALLSPYFVRNQAGQIYPPALTFLVFGITDYCKKSPESKLIDAVHQNASDLAKLVNKANAESEKDIKQSERGTQQ